MATRREFAVLATLTLMMLTAACTKSEPVTTSQQSSSTTESSTTATSAAPPPVVAPSASVPPASASSVPVPAPASGKALATTDGELPGTRIDVTELKRNSGDTVTLKFTLANGSDKPISFSNYWLGDRAAGGETDYTAVGGVHLIDPVGKKKYFAVRDSDQKCICSRELAAVPNGTSVNLWVKFAAPPADVQRISVVVPHFTPMDDVPIQ